MISLTGIVCAALLQLPPLPNGARTSFVDFSDDLARPEIAVVYGTLRKINEGKKDRLSGKDADLGEGGVTITMTGVVHYKVACTGKVEAADVLHGAEKPGDVPMKFDVQLSSMPDGTKRRYFLTSPKFRADDATTALWVLEKPKSGDAWRLVKMLSLDAAAGADKARDQAADVFEINRRVSSLRAALSAADAKLAKGDKPGAAATLKEALAAAKPLRLPQSDSLAAMHSAPFEQRAQAKLADLGADGADAPH